VEYADATVWSASCGHDSKYACRARGQNGGSPTQQYKKNCDPFSSKEIKNPF